MEFPIEAPKAIVDLLPESLRPYAIILVGGALCIGSVVALLLGLAILRGFGKRAATAKSPELIEDLTVYPDLQSSGGDRQLRVEGVPVRLRLVVIAPAGHASDVDLDDVQKILDELLPGLGGIYQHDKPRVKKWPTQVSYQGFGNHFHACMKTGGAEGEQTRWALVAGRVKVGKKQYMLGVALQSIKPNTVGRRTIDAHEWVSVLRVRVRD